MNDTPSTEATPCTEHEVEAVAEANATGKQPVVFVHGLWLLPSSWDRWREVFEDAGYATLAPGWPGDPDTVEEAKEHPKVFAHKSIGQIADHFGGCQRVLQVLGAKRGRDRDRRDPEPRSLAHDRRRLAGGLRQGARVRGAVRLKRGSVRGER